MAGTKETPRQKMIAMMYLVLMALLALNVSKDVINAFIVVNESITSSNENASQKLRDIYSNFEKNYQVNKIKVKPFWDKAKEARILSNEMVDYVKNVKYELISLTEGIPLDSAKIIPATELEKKDNNTIPTNYFIGGFNKDATGKAKELKEKIIEYRNKMLDLVEPRNLENVKLGLVTEGPYYNADGQEQSWETHFFYNTILAADIPILNKIIADILNAEYDVVNVLHKSIGQGEFKFDKIEAKILPKSDFVFIGEDYTAEIIVAAYDTSQSPEVYYSQGIDYLPATQYEEATRVDTKPGEIGISMPARSEGIKKYAGFVRAKTSTGMINDYHFKGEYIVAEPSYTISAKKMNVFYVGVSNPVSISISGIPNEDLIPAISCGTIERDPGSDDWIVNIPPGFIEAVINITAQVNGVNKQIGSKRFRIKNLPDPIATIANKSSGVINRDIMIAAGALSPKMPNDFEFDHSFVISSFTLTFQKGFRVYHFESENAYLTDEMVEQIKRTNRGQNIVFENIIVRDPDGIERRIAPLVLTLE